MKTLLDKKTAVFTAAVFLFVFIFSGCRDSSVSKTALKLDTVVTVTLFGDADTAAIDSAFAEIDRLAALLDVNEPDSEIACLCRNAGEWMEVSDETAEVLRLANKYYVLSGGYFDVTAAPLVKLWNINGGGYFPLQDEIEAAASMVDGAELKVDGNRAKLAENMSADLGGIAKGYIADKVKEHLVHLGVENAVIDLGGNVLLIGAKPDGSEFKVGIKDPLGKNGEMIAMVSGRDESLVSSGIYERYFEHNGKRYHHIIDPFTGFPSDSDLAGVTVISKSSAEGDALSTSCMLMGSRAGMELIEDIPDAEAIFVTRDGEVIMSSGMPGRT